MTRWLLTAGMSLLEMYSSRERFPALYGECSREHSFPIQIEKCLRERSAANYEGGYGTQLNGGSESVPLRPVRSIDRNMFVIPRALSHGDRLVVSGNLNNSNRFTTNFLTGSPNPDYNNIACQLDADFQNNEIALRIIENGQQAANTNPAPADMISGSQVTLDFKFEGRNGTTLLVVFANDSSVDMLELMHDVNRITFLEVKGLNVTELSFKFSE